MKRSIYYVRMHHLADFLDTVPEENFCCGSFANDLWDSKKKKNLSCGTTACALGWATAMPLFQKLGLKLTRENPRSDYVVVLSKPGSEDLSAGLAAATVFNITLEVAYDFFIHATYGNKAKVIAKNLRTYAETHQASPDWDFKHGFAYCIETIGDLALFTKEQHAFQQIVHYKGKYEVTIDDAADKGRRGYASDKDVVKSIRRAVSRFRGVPEEAL